ncbi:hypothetical protein [Variovorax sp. J31P207]|uniref:hypothetical protein n=1 Tax=Variovorax sp. J31P207 TaxID=3053510 RepID=UPI0025781FF2|nr:hypothetical protein [Variovorax sp. J31P207]MDM0068372.1 hypothetical protein [Variovorax sp. J31P207]
MQPGERYERLKALVKEMPAFAGPATPDDRAWLGRAVALVDAGINRTAVSTITVASHHLYGPLHDMNVQQIAAVVYAELAAAELQAPQGAQGAFIGTQTTFDVVAAMSAILRDARGDVLIVDPYVDAITLTDFVSLAPEGVRVRLLADEQDLQPNLAPAATRWLSDHPTRPIEVRVAAARSLHDRLVIVDAVTVWNLTQSLKDFARRSPGAIERSNPDIAQRKIAAYSDTWDKAKVLAV